MPTTPSRARKWIKSGKATPFWKRGIFCVRLNAKPSNTKTQDIAVGIDTGSKKEAFTLKSELHTYLNIQADAVTWVKNTIKIRRDMRMTRRGRHCPYRQPKPNRNTNSTHLPPSTKSRWQWKLRILNWLRKIYPISCIIVEDIKATTHKGSKKWNKLFSPLEVGKQWFYSQIREFTKLKTKKGFETKELRDNLGLTKSGNKLSNKFDAHCVDSWVLSNWYTGGHTTPDNKEILLISPIQLHRRQLHRFQPDGDGFRKRYGGTRSLGFKRGSLIKHAKLGVTYIGGHRKSTLSLHSLIDGKRLTTDAKLNDCKFLTFNSWRYIAIPYQAYEKEETNDKTHKQVERFSP
jgi:hypothetical protein